MSRDGSQPKVSTPKDPRRARALLEALLASRPPAGGRADLPAMVGRLGTALGADVLYVGELVEPEPATIRLIAIHPTTLFPSGHSYRLDGTPCSSVVGLEACAFPRGVRELFPDDAMLQRHEIESYVGVPLWDSLGRPLGLTAALGRRPLTDPAVTQSVLETMAGWVASEIERDRAAASLRETERRSRAVFESIPVGLHQYRLEDDGRLVFVGANPAADRILGVDNREFVGRTIEEAFPALADSEIPAAYRRAASEGTSWRSDQVVYESGNISGAFLVEAFQTSPGEMAAAFLDITSRKRTEMELRASEAHLARLNRITRAALEAPDLAGLVRLLADQLADLAEADGGLVVLWDDERGQVSDIATSGPLAAMPPPPEGALAEAVGEALDTGGPSWASAESDPHGTGLGRLLTGELASVLGLPLMAGGRRLGAAFVAHTHDHTFTASEISSCEQVANQVALAVFKARLDHSNRQRVATLLALHETGVELSVRRDLDQLLNAIIERASRLLGAELAGLYLMRPEGYLELMIAQGVLEPLVSLRIQPGEGAGGEATRTGEPILIDDYSRWPNRIRRYESQQFGSVIAAPLVWRGETLGALFAEHDTRGFFGREDLEVVSLFAAQAAAAVANSRLFESLNQAYAELENAYDATLEGWVRALDLRDKETQGHTQRVSELAVELARAMGMAEADLDDVRRGALLHDIGKIGIPDSILLKPGPLDEEETRIMQRHTELAHAMLSSIPRLLPAVAIPHCHHERWDGSGYPQGLAGEEIPLAARIFAVVDVFDALSFDRPYRRAWPRERVIRHLREEAGRLFDPRIVEVFLSSVCHE